MFRNYNIVIILMTFAVPFSYNFLIVYVTFLFFFIYLYIILKRYLVSRTISLRIIL